MTTIFIPDGDGGKKAAWDPAWGDPPTDTERLDFMQTHWRREATNTQDRSTIFVWSVACAQNWTLRDVIDAGIANYRMGLS